MSNLYKSEDHFLQTLRNKFYFLKHEEEDDVKMKRKMMLVPSCHLFVLEFFKIFLHKIKSNIEHHLV